MGLIVPLLIGVLLVPDPGPSQRRLADFSQIQKAVNKSIYVVDQAGNERLMRLVGATDDVLTLELGPRRLTMPRDEVLRVDREHDRSIDGLVKGLVFGAGMGLLVRGLGGGSSEHVFQAMAVYGSIGYLLDRGNRSRQPLYRAPVVAVTVPF